MSPIRLAQAVDPDAARRTAQDILGDRRFQDEPAPKPLRGVTQWTGDRLQGVFDWLGRVIETVPWWIWLTLAAVVIAAVVTYIARRLQRRAEGVRSGSHESTSRPEDDDPNALERDAEAAERDGDLDRAIRLRFRAGLIRLGTRDAIAYRPSITTAEVRNALESGRFDDLATTFEGVAYGGRRADEPAVGDARREWPRVLDEAGRRS